MCAMCSIELTMDISSSGCMSLLLAPTGGTLATGRSGTTSGRMAGGVGASADVAMAAAEVDGASW